MFCHPVCQKGKPETLWLGLLVVLRSHTSLFLFLIQQDLGEAGAQTVSHFVLGTISEENIRHVLMHGTNECMKKPPVTIRRYLETKRERQLPVNDQQSISALARETLLPESDVEMWLEHLSAVSERLNAGATRKSKRRSHDNLDHRLGKTFVSPLCPGPYCADGNEYKYIQYCAKVMRANFYEI